MNKQSSHCKSYTSEMKSSFARYPDNIYKGQLKTL